MNTIIQIKQLKMQDQNDIKNLNKMKNFYNMAIEELPENIIDFL